MTDLGALDVARVIAVTRAVDGLLAVGMIDEARRLLGDLRARLGEEGSILRRARHS